MKKLSALCLMFCLVIALTGCSNFKTIFGTDSKPAASTENKVENKTESSNESKTDTDDDLYYKSYPENPYAPHEITGAEITTTDTEKTIKTGAFTISVPLDWECLEINGEDGGSYLFSHPTLGEKCRLTLGVTGAEYKTNRTQDEYLEYFKDTDRDDVEIESITAEKLDGTDCTKIVSTYSHEGAKFVRIDYDNAIRGSILYDVIIMRPSENSELKNVLDNIVESIKFSAKG